MRRCRLWFSGEELSNLVRTVVLPVLKGRSWTSAIVVAGPAEFGVSRQYQVLSEQHSRDAIFYDFDEARRGLAKQP